MRACAKRTPVAATATSDDLCRRFWPPEPSEPATSAAKWGEHRERCRVMVDRGLPATDLVQRRQVGRNVGAFSDTKNETGKIAVKVINHYGDEVLKVYPVS